MRKRILHKPIRNGSVGKVDSWGFGSWARCWDYPGLGLKGVATTGSCGGVRYPRINGVSPVFTGLADYCPTLHWGMFAPTYNLPDGRVVVAIDLDGDRCFEEWLPLPGGCACDVGS